MTRAVNELADRIERRLRDADSLTLPTVMDYLAIAVGEIRRLQSLADDAMAELGRLRGDEGP